MTGLFVASRAVGLGLIDATNDNLLSRHSGLNDNLFNGACDGSSIRHICLRIRVRDAKLPFPRVQRLNRRTGKLGLGGPSTADRQRVPPPITIYCTSLVFPFVEFEI